MPIVTIELLEDQPRSALPDGALQRLADGLGELFGSSIAGTWIRLNHLPRERYAENHTLVDKATRPAFVEILKSDPGTTESLEAEAAAVSALVAKHLERPPENVHVLYLPPGRNRIAFGGKLLQ